MMTILQECKNLLAKEASVKHRFKVGDQVMYNGTAKGSWAKGLEGIPLIISFVSAGGSSYGVSEVGFTFHDFWLDPYGTVVFEGEV